MINENLSKVSQSTGDRTAAETLKRVSDGTEDGEPRRVSPAGRLMRSLLHRLGDPAIQVELWNGETICTSPRPPATGVRIADRPTLLKLLTNPVLAFGEAYTAGRITVWGEMTQLVEEFYRGGSGHDARPRPRRRLWSAYPRSRRRSLAQSRDNIHHHYDIGNEFYELWLGNTMAYTCAYFPSEAATLDEAQIAKMHHVSRKLRLRPGDRVVEAGCGWGGLALHMARHYGVNVTAFNISHEQIAYARARAASEGLADRVQYVEDDYRNIRGLPGTFDAFVSVGMLEHVDTADYAEFGHIIAGSLNRSGRGLVHSIGRVRPGGMSPWIAKHIFPGAHAPALTEMMEIFETADLPVIDVENLRPHYARTLHYWRQNFERSTGIVREMFDERFVRMWRLYLAGSEAAFNTGDLQLFQVVFAARTNHSLPWTRADLYRDMDVHGRL